MARMPLMAAAAAAAGGRRRLVDLWATAPSGFNWQEPLGENSFPPWPSWSRETKNEFLFSASFLGIMGLVIVCWAIHRLFCRNNKDDDQDTSRFVLGNNDDGEAVIGPLPPVQEQQLPESGDGNAPQSNGGEEGDRPPQRRRRRRHQPPAVAEMPAADEEMALGDVQLTQVGVEWMLANMELLAPTADMDMAPPAADEEIAPAPEPGPTLKCTFNTADGWEEGTCSVCLSELVDGEKVRVLTACMHCFHATCIGRWLSQNPTCPTCRAPVMVRRRRRTQA